MSESELRHQNNRKLVEPGQRVGARRVSQLAQPQPAPPLGPFVCTLLEPSWQEPGIPGQSLGRLPQHLIQGAGAAASFLSEGPRNVGPPRGAGASPWSVFREVAMLGCVSDVGRLPETSDLGPVAPAAVKQVFTRSGPGPGWAPGRWAQPRSRLRASP